LTGKGFSTTLGHGPCPSDAFMKINSDSFDKNQFGQPVFITCNDDAEVKKYLEHPTTKQFFIECSSKKGNSFTAVVPVKNHEDNTCAVAWLETWDSEASLKEHNNACQTNKHIEWITSENFSMIMGSGPLDNKQTGGICFNAAKVCLAVMVHCKSADGVSDYLNADSTLAHLKYAREAKGNAYSMVLGCTTDVLWIEGFETQEAYKTHMDCQNTQEHIKFVRQNQWDFTLGSGVPHNIKIQDSSFGKNSRAQVVFVDCGDEKGAKKYLNSESTQKHFNDATAKGQCSYAVLFQSGKHCVWIETWDGEKDFNDHMNSESTKAHIDWLQQQNFTFQLGSGTLD